MVFKCDACKRVYELDRRDVRCVYCGACRCHPLESFVSCDEDTRGENGLTE